MSTCLKAEIAEWKKSQCESVCPKVSSCAEKCDSPYSPCADACVKKLMGPSCPEKWRAVCLGQAQSPATFAPP